GNDERAERSPAANVAETTQDLPQRVRIERVQRLRSIDREETDRVGGLEANVLVRHVVSWGFGLQQKTPRCLSCSPKPVACSLVFGLEVEAVRGLDAAERPRPRAHHDRVRRRAPAEESYALEEVSG